MSGLISYWPNQEEINKCIKTEAETASDAVLLAVHQECAISVRDAGRPTTNASSEKRLLDSFLSEDMPEGTLVLAITGASGVGKSHMIRWLAAQLERDPRAKKMHVIRVPKSANLKSVVELILEPLSKNEKFAKARKELEEAVSSVNPDDGAVHFAADIEVALKEQSKIYKSELENEPGGSFRAKIMAKLHHAKNLPHYFSDAALSEHFKGKVLPKIVKRAILGKNENQEDQFPQFSIEDLKLPEEVNLGGAAREVQIYYKTVLNKGENNDGYKLAVEVLNTVVDRAIRNLFRLNQAMGGVTLEEIVLQIRTLLLQEEKELVLLIEDFAALSGIQEVLLNVCIQEAVRDGKIVRSPMRTALAVTDGYLASRDTILTRAKREWIVESNLSDETEVLLRTRQMVGAYINAARWGEAALINFFKDSRQKSSKGITNWVKVYRDDTETPETADILNAFGEDKNSIPLFPFNQNAINLLIEDHLRVAGRLQFNPRKIINEVIRATLSKRSYFESSSFPPSDFSPRTPNAEIAGWVANANLSETDKYRMRQMIIYWGGHPKAPRDLGSVNSKIFEAFSLKSPTELGIEAQSVQIEADRKTPLDEGQIARVDPIDNTEVKTQVEDQFVIDWRERLDKWSNGEALTQAPANQVRNSIVNALNRSIDWVALCMKPIEATNAIIEIPNARNNPTGGRKLTIASDAKDVEGNLRRTILAFLRYDNHKGEWDYPEIDEDTVLIANAIEDLKAQYIKIIREELNQDISTLATALSRQGKILGVSPKILASRKSLIDAMFTNPTYTSATSSGSTQSIEKWNNLKIRSAEEREAFQKLLLHRVGAFQGDGDKPYAVDVANITLSEADNFNQRNELKSTLLPAQREYLSDISLQKLNGRIKELVKDLDETFDLFEAFFDENINKIDVLKSFKDLAEKAEFAGIWPSSFPLKKKNFQELIEAIPEAPFSETREQILALRIEHSKGDVEGGLHALGKVQFSKIDEINTMLRTMINFLECIEKEVSDSENHAPEYTIEELIDKNSEALTALNTVMLQFQNDCDQS